MKKLNILTLMLLLSSSVLVYAQDNVGIGTTTPEPSAALDVEANDKGVLVPRLSTTQRTGIVSPAEGLLVYDTDVECFFYFKLSFGWENLCAGGTGATGPAGPAGAAGAQGPQGTIGATGPAGAARGAGPAGAQDTQGTVVTKVPGRGIAEAGRVGTAGAKGPAGTIGATGPAGAIGPAGPAGPAGAQGPAGTIGATGPAGPAGATGTAGPQGPQGPQGPTADVQSVSLASDINITSTVFTNVPSMGTVTFIATKPTALVLLSASGHGYTGSMSYVSFKVLNGGANIGGTHTNIQNYDDWTGTTTTWSCSFNKLITGLVVGNSYTISVQAKTNGISGVSTAIINPIAQSETEHLTLSVLQ